MYFVDPAIPTSSFNFIILINSITITTALILQKSAEERASTVTMSNALLGHFTAMASMNAKMAVMNRHPALKHLLTSQMSMPSSKIILTSRIFTDHCLDMLLA